MNDEKQIHWLARTFIKQREIIEAAETPFAKLAVFVLPIISPAVPAFMTGLHLYKLFLEMFTFQYANEVSIVMSSTIALVLELLGYVGAISFIKSLFLWIKTRKEEYLVPFALNGVAYGFYLVAMFLINVQLGKYFGTSQIINNIVALLSFITVPTSLLAANHLNQVEDSELEERRHQEKREDDLKKRMIKKGINPVTGLAYNQDSAIVKQQSSPNQNTPLSTDWRVMKKILTAEQKRRIAEDSISETARKWQLSARTAENWKKNCQNGNV